jgi:hypothetical protein
MADRRPDDVPLAPRRSLAGRNQAGDQSASANPTRSPSERVSAAVTSPSAPSGAPPSTARRTPKSRPDSGSSSRGSTATTQVTQNRATTAKQAPNRPARPRRTRKARLRMTHVDPWSVMKVSFLLSIAFGIVTVVAVALVWSVLGAAGVWESINDTVRDVIGSGSASNFDIQTYFGTSRVLGFTMVVAAVDVVLITAIATLGAFLYNLAAALLGGLEVTLAEDEH